MVVAVVRSRVGDMGFLGAVVGEAAVLAVSELAIGCEFMQCKYPYAAPGGAAFGCGNCIGCRANRSRIWAHRILLETHSHNFSSFVTLTYEDTLMPRSPTGLPTLDPRDLTTWLKRFRKKVGGQSIRYYACGEYGEKYHRPHYHLVLFGFPGCSCFELRRSEYCVVCNVVRNTWGRGHISNQRLTPALAAYAAGYTSRKISSARKEIACAKDLGIVPPFSRMSLKPGIGAHFMPKVAATLSTHGLYGTDNTSVLRHGSQLRPMGPYLKRRLRKLNGTTSNAKAESIQAYKEELRVLFEASQEAAPGFRYFAFRNAIADANAGKIARIEWLDANTRGEKL